MINYIYLILGTLIISMFLISTMFKGDNTYVEVELIYNNKSKSYFIKNDIFILLKFIMSNEWDKCYVNGKEIKK